MLHKRQLSGLSDCSGSPRKRPINLSQESASAAVSAARLDHATGSMGMHMHHRQPAGSVSGSPLHHVSPNHMHQSMGYLTAGLPHTEHIIHPSRSKSNFTYDTLKGTATNHTEHYQSQQLHTPMATRSINSTGLQSIGISPPSPVSPSTAVESDSSSSGSRQRKAMHRQEEGYSCKSCMRKYTRACDLK